MYPAHGGGGFVIIDSPPEAPRIAGAAAANPLCCCEYIDRDRQRSHLAACCCNCVDLDEAFERLICCRRIPAQTSANMLLTLQDRLRVPWRGGALRVAATTLLPLPAVPAALMLAAQGPLWTVAVAVAMPAFLVFMQRRLGRTEPRTKFFFVWNMWSILLLWILFESTVPLLEVLPEENFIMIMLMTASVLCFYKLRDRAPLNFVVIPAGEKAGKTPSAVSPSASSASTALLIESEDTLQMDAVIGGGSGSTKSGGGGDAATSSTEDDDGESTEADEFADDPQQVAAAGSSSNPMQARLLSNPAVCRRCRKYAPPRSYHCFRCGTCVVRQDHHNVWLDCCVGQTGYRLYFVGGAFGCAALLFAANLALTSICHPWLVGSVFGVYVFLPDDCGEVYEQFDVSMCFVGALYALAIALCMGADWLRQVWQITNGRTWAEQRHGHRSGQRRNVLHNWKVFICLMRG